MTHLFVNANGIPMVLEESVAAQVRAYCENSTYRIPYHESLTDITPDALEASLTRGERKEAQEFLRTAINFYNSYPRSSL